jgi:hypothetical protein
VDNVPGPPDVWGSVAPPPAVLAEQPPSPTGPDPAGKHRPAVGWRSLVAAGLLSVSAALHIAMVFPAQGHLVPAFDDHAYLVVQQVVLAVGWLAAAGLVARGRPVPATAGAVLATGIAAAELGVVVANLCQVLAESTAGVGAWMLVAAWMVGLVGAVLSLVAAGPVGMGELTVLGRPGRLVGRGSVVMVVVGTAAAVAAGVALLPAWDHYVITSSALHRTIARESLGSAFASGTPRGVLEGDLLTAVAFAFVPVVGLWWRPGRVGALLGGGVLVVVAAQLISAVVGLKSSPGSFGITAAQVRTYGVEVHSSLTAWFVAEAVAGVALLLVILARWWRTPQGWTWRIQPQGAGPPRPDGASDRGNGTIAGGKANGGWGPPVPAPPDPSGPVKR